jgi:hypothetical protein
MPRVIGVDLLREMATAPSEAWSPARTRLRGEAIELLKTEDLVEASYSYNIVPLEGPAAETLHVGGEALYAPQMLPVSGELTALGCGVTTLGSRIEGRVRMLFGEKRASLAMALDGLANEMLIALDRRIQDRMLSECYRRRLTMAGDLRAGDPGLDISAQAAVLRLADAQSIGVEVNASHLMKPLKSTSLVLGVGRDLPAVTWSRCDTCPSSKTCSFGYRPKVTMPNRVAT